MDRERVRQFIDLLFQYVETVPASDFYPHIEAAEQAIGDIDPDDVLYVACALARDAGVWSDDSAFAEQDLVPVFTTSDVFEAFETKCPRSCCEIEVVPAEHSAINHWSTNQ
jgi:predicted nucleic acid-binding protein